MLELQNIWAYLLGMTTVEKLLKTLNEFMGSPDGYTTEELRDIYRIAKTLKETAAETIVEFYWQENAE